MTTTRHLRNADGLLAPAVAQTTQALSGDAMDAAAARLALLLAESIDNSDGCPECCGKAGVIAALAPKLLAVLVELGATPKARASASKGGAPDAQSPLDKLRAARSS